MKQKNSERIKVAVRCRPLNKKETANGNLKCVNIDVDRGEIIVKKLDENDAPRNFFFDRVYDDSLTQERIFNETSLPIVESVVQGYNGTIFAYGQTGTGKTYTMEGDIQDDEIKGIIPRSFEMIFSMIKTTYNTNYLIRISYLELYNEEVKDLLSKSNNKQKLDIREDPESGFYVKDLSTYVVKSPKDMIHLLEKGKELRHVAGTDMNERSSRSHSIFTIIVDNSAKDDAGEDHVRMGKLNLVDLAGSERQSKTKATGSVMNEAININLSLTALGKVINALVSDKKQHIPYRDSKLTKLLMDSLGGNSKTVMIANIGPADYNYDETISTLRYANRAKNIKNAPKINEDPKDTMIRQYQEELAKLKKALAEAGGEGVAIPEGVSGNEEGIISTNSKQKVQEMEDKLEKEKEDMLHDLENEKKKIEESKKIEEDEKIKLLEKLKAKQSDQEKQNKNKESLVKKLKMLEEKFVIGEENEKKAKENEEIIQKTKKEIELREKKRDKIREELEKHEEEKMMLDTKFADQQTEISEKEKVFQKLKEKLMEMQNEEEELKKDFDQDYNEIYEFKRQLEREISFKNVLISHLLPKKYMALIDHLMQFDEETGQWFIEGFDLYMNQLNKLEEQAGDSHQIAMGYDDEEVFNSEEKDININKMLMEADNQPKSVYKTYDDVLKKSKKASRGTAKGKKK